jgi:hypothetical protein
MAATLSDVAPAEEHAPEVITDADTLRRVLTGAVIGPIDHSACEHEANNTERRRCRRERMKSAMSKAFIEADGERYISLTFVRAEVLHVADKQRWCSAGQNATLRRLGLEPVNYDAANTDDITAVATFVRSANDESYGNGEFTQGGITRRLASFASQVGIRDASAELLEFGQVNRRVVTYEGDTVLNEESQRMRRARLRFRLAFAFNGWSEAQKKQHIQRVLTQWGQYSFSGEVVTMDEFSIAPPSPQKVNDTVLLRTYREVLGVNRGD